MADIPNLAGVATADLVEKIGAGNFQASYINWSRTLNLLRENAPGWLPEAVVTAEGGILHRAPVGGFLLLRFRHGDGTTTPEVPQAVMDHRNAAIQFDKITARDITDTHRRGVCMAAALTFGLAYELWAKVALESGYGEAAEKPAKPASIAPGVSATGRASPTDGAWEAMDDESQGFLLGLAANIRDHFQGEKPTDDEADKAHAYMLGQQLTAEEKLALWTQLHSSIRSALKRANERANKKEAA